MNNILEIQQAFMAAGFQWQEHIFNDDKPECMIECTRDKSPHALGTYPRPVDSVGWGRFDRETAWYLAYEWLKTKGNSAAWKEECDRRQAERDKYRA